MTKTKKPKTVYRDRRARQLSTNGRIATGIAACGALFIGPAWMAGGGASLAPATTAVAALTALLAATALGCFWLAAKTQDRYDRVSAQAQAALKPAASTPPAPPALTAAPVPTPPLPLAPPAAPTVVDDSAVVYVGSVLPAAPPVTAPVPERVR